MASNSTSFLGLSQWVPNDYVQRGDFNSDNSKIDAAIKELRGEVLSTVTTSASCSRIQLNVAGINWSDYMSVQMDISMNTSVACTCFVRVNADQGGNTGGYCTFPGITSSDGNGIAIFSSKTAGTVTPTARVTFYPLKSSVTLVTSENHTCAATYAYHGTSFGYTNSQYYSAFTAIYITPSTTATIPAGAKITIRGYKI